MLLAAFAMTVPTAYAGPGCCAKKKAAKAARGTDGFPAMLAKGSGKKTVFVVAGDEFVSEAKAMSALADASEQFVGQFVAISCVVDGKVIRCGESCDEAKKACGSMASKAGCGKMAKAGGKGCGSKAGKSGCGSKAAKGGCGSKATKAGSDCCKDRKGCTEAKKANGTCCSSKKGKVVKADAKGCGSKAGKSGCGSKDAKGGCGSKAAKGGCGSKKGMIAKTNGKDCCPEGKNVIFRVAGKQFKSKDAAIAAHKQVTAAMKTVQMTYLVDGEAVHCSSEITDKAKAAGKVKYCVGKSKTNCHLTARVELAKAQYAAAKNACGKLVIKAL